MARTFSSTDLVQLPILDVQSALTLGTEVVSASKPFKSLPEAVTDALHDVKHTLLGLQQAAARRLPAQTTADPLRSKAADTTIDAYWSGSFDWLTGWSKCAGLPEAAIARRLLDKLFPDGLKFTLLAYKLEWAESNTRIGLIQDEGLDPDFKKLGGSTILAGLRKAHKEYGEALGITKAPATTSTDTASLREALDTFVDALREYVVQASAMVRKKDPSTAETSRALLTPIATWETPGGKAKEAPAPEEPPAEPTAP